MRKNQNHAVLSFVLIASGCASLACGSQKTGAAASPAASPSPALAADANESAKAAPTQAELDAQAAKQIGEANADAELEKLTKEIEDGGK